MSFETIQVIDIATTKNQRPAFKKVSEFKTINKISFYEGNNYSIKHRVNKKILNGNIKKIACILRLREEEVRLFLVERIRCENLKEWTMI